MRLIGSKRVLAKLIQRQIVLNFGPQNTAGGTMMKPFICNIFFLLVLTGLPREAQAARNCSVPFIRSVNDLAVNGTMTVKTGARCSIGMRSRGPTYGASIVTQASHGSAHVRGHSVIYQSRKGYVGNDAFTYARIGLDTQNKQVKRTVNISVEVTP